MRDFISRASSYNSLPSQIRIGQARLSSITTPYASNKAWNLNPAQTVCSQAIVICEFLVQTGPGIGLSQILDEDALQNTDLWHSSTDVLLPTHHYFVYTSSKNFLISPPPPQNKRRNLKLEIYFLIDCFLY